MKINRFYINVLFTLALIMLAYNGYTQSLNISGVVLDSRTKLSNATVTVKQGGSVVNTITTSASGSFSVDLDLDTEYTLVFSHSDFVSKIIEVNTNDVPPSEKGNMKFPKWTIDLYPKDLPVDYSVFDRPVGKVLYVPGLMAFGIDVDYKDQISGDMEAIKAQVDQAVENIIAEKEAVEAEFKQALRDGDSFLKSKEYESAIDQYNAALGIKPDDTYAQKQIAKAQGLLNASAELEEQYANYLTQGDNAFESENWEEARTAYQAAADLKKSEKYPKEQLSAIDVKIKEAEEAKIKEEYDALIAEADGAFDATQYEQAKGLYEQAAQKIPKETYPKTRLNEIKAKLAEIAKQNGQYDATVSKADQLFASEKYEEAKAKYEEASQIKPDEEYPPQKVTEIEGILADLQAKKEAEEAEYQDAIASADAAFDSGEFEKALADYQKAQEIKPKEKYPSDKIKEVNTKLGNLAKVQEQYDKLIAEADGLLAGSELEKAKSKYEEASNVKQEESYPKDKIAEIEQQIADAAAAKEAELAALKAEYDKLIADADAAFGANDFETAKGLYQQASDKMPDESYPKDQIKAADAKLGDLAKADEAYQKVISKADELLADQKLEEATAKYEEAKSLKPDDTYPQQKIDEIAGIIAKQEADKAAAEKAKAEAQAALKAEYDKLIADADAAFGANDFETAKGLYQQASDKMPNESYPKDQIKAADAKLGDLAKADEAYQKVISKADELLADQKLEEATAKYEEAKSLKPDDTYPQQKINEIASIIQKKKAEEEALAKAAEEMEAAKKAEYDKLIADADAAFGANDFETAKGLYQQASDKMPDESYPKDQIKAANSKLGDLAKANEAYQKVISKADELMANEKLADAKAKYEEAKSLKPDDVYPQQKIDEIANLIAKQEADKAAAKQAEADALASAKAAYDKLISDADGAFGANDFGKAKGLYQQASDQNPKESYPKDQLKEIEKKQGELAKTDEAYQKVISKADELMANEKLADAKAKYEEAKSLKPDDAYPKQKIDEIANLIAKQEADKAAAKQAEADALASAKAAYDKLISDADVAFGANDFGKAKGLYQQASDQNPKESYPKDQLKEIEKKQGELAKTDEAYQKVISKADELMANEKLADAKAKYEEAKSLKPDDAYPQQKIDEIAEIIAKQEADKAAAKQAEADALASAKAAYDKLISDADAAFGANDFGKAKGLYQQASDQNPKESYPKDQLKEIEKKQGALADQEKDYQKAIEKADKLYADEKWIDAQIAYTEANGIKADDYPKGKIDEIQKKLDQIEKTKQDQLAADAKAKEEADKKAKYNDLVASGDKALSKEDYEVAKANFKEALAVLPNESYPKQKITEIDSLIKAKQDQLVAEAKAKEKADKKAKYDDLVASGDKAFSKEDYEVAKANFKEALAVLPNESYPQQKITEIDSLIKAKQDQLAAEAKAKEEARIKADKERLAKLEAEYQAIIDEADQLLKEEKYNNAKKAYKKALNVLADKTYPAQKITEIDHLIATKENAEQGYKSAIARGDKLFKSEDWENAISSYKDALNFKPEETYPKTQIDLAQSKWDALVAAKKAADKAEQERLAKIKAEYDQFIQKADQAFFNKEYNNAKELYGKAKAVNSKETYPNKKISEINKLLNDKEMIEKNYKEFIAKGDLRLRRKNFEDAVNMFKEASTLKPEEKYPREQLAIAQAEYDRIKSAQDARIAAENARIAAIEKEYKETIKAADAAFKKKNYQEAKNKYFAAQNIKPQESYSAQQVAAINQAIKDELANRNKKRKEQEYQENLDNYYSLMIAQGDHFFETENYLAAVEKYREASNIKTKERYPKTQIKKANAAEAKRKKLLAQEQKQKELAAQTILKFRRHMYDGNLSLGSRAYADAISDFKKALKVVPESKEAVEKLNNAEAELAEKKRREKEQAAKIAEAKRNEKAYAKTINKADKYYNGKKWQMAKKEYEHALSIFPKQAYPKVRLNKVMVALAEIERKKSEKKPEKPEFISPLAKKYPQGKSTETRKLGNKTVTDVVIVKGNRADKYQKIEYNYGKIFYFKNGNEYDTKSWKMETGI